ncbi:MAG: squalene/phytoene synthase family protein, partial [Casimicrobium sp.]
MKSATRMSVDNHYENFPVASWLVPAHLRPAVAAIYRFARGADDIADEGDASNESRLHELSSILNGLKDVFSGISTNNKIALHAQYFLANRFEDIDEKPFAALISAFAQDVVKTRYATRAELLDYANRSANPVGRMMLALFAVRTESAKNASDA